MIMQLLDIKPTGHFFGESAGICGWQQRGQCANLKTRIQLWIVNSQAS